MASPQNAASTGGGSDGGGVRGLSSLVILRSLLGQVQAVVGVPLNPHDIFDLVVGTSTGGLIALMIGKLGMTVDECIEQYKRLSGVIFVDGRHLRGRMTLGLLKERYSEGVLCREIEELFRRKGRNPAETMATSVKLLPETERAHSAVVCREYIDTPNGPPRLKPEAVLLCSHPCPGPRIRCTVCRAGRATSAAPSYFPPQMIQRDGQKDARLIDGGLQFSNPSVAAWYHYRRRTHKGLEWEGSRLISLGTGRYDGESYHPPQRTRLKRLIHMPSAITLMRDATTDPNNTATHMEEIAGLSSVNIEYHRFSATTGVCWIKMDDYKSLEFIERRTDEYLRFPDVSREITECAESIAQDYIEGLNRSAGELGNGEAT
ncbi:hypothetical protein FGG08_001129 [Glutinoglossum americanum]|uniref:PNPLA domain-containing protein n=1 Tax=Glutinoglossum americanum TaxID=1670608 RepID=A0A9P8IFD0_9PEZI|nr:hypothetical protein FGG08_001129 [Glutinoglossum americanum]